MYKTLLSAITAAVLLASCGGGNADKANTSSEQTVAQASGKEFTIADTSVVRWTATHKGGLKPRWGTLKITEGSLSVDSNKITAGNFTVDINSLHTDSASVTDPGKTSVDLDNHLKSPDFFDAAKFPTAKFAITKVDAFDSTKAQSAIAGATNLISGNLTIKDSTINITFPAKVTITDNGASVKASFSVDRTSWGLNYGTKGSAADWMISKDFQIDLDLAATAK